ncbi:hypothetical protein EBS57_08975 [bacterium]|nr:hypothetical protein [bacterium]
MEVLNGVVIHTTNLKVGYGTAIQITGPMADRGRPLPLLAQVKQGVLAVHYQLQSEPRSICLEQLQRF